MLPLLIIVLILVGSVIGNIVANNRVPGKHSAAARDRKA
jgi:hypothetical protein